MARGLRHSSRCRLGRGVSDVNEDFGTFDPEATARMQRRRRFRRVPLRVLLPNAITLLSLCAGMTAIRMAGEGRFDVAVGAIVLACVLDALDGRIARMLKGTSRFGAELDSLADFVSFGVAPAVVLHIWSLHLLKGLGWIVALAFAVCTALRLARFNVALDDPDKPAWKTNFFTGVPAPAGAGLALLPMYLAFMIGFDGSYAAIGLLFYVPFVGFLMVSRIPTFSSKLAGERIRGEAVLPVLILVVLFTSLLVSYPWEMLTALALAYLAVIPLGMLRYRRLEERHARAAEAKAGNTRSRSEEAG